MNFLLALSVVGSFVSILWIIMFVNIGLDYGWDRSNIRDVIKGFIGLVIFGSILGWNWWYDKTYIQPTIDRSFQVEVKNVPKGYRFEGYLVNRDTGERKNVIEKAE